MKRKITFLIPSDFQKSWQMSYRSHSTIKKMQICGTAIEKEKKIC